MNSRDQFERWAISDAVTQGVSLALRRNGDWYFEEGITSYLNTAWAAWQAARSG